MNKIYLFFILLVTLVSCKEKEVYMFSYFGSQSYGLKLAYSYDGYHYKELYKKDSSAFLVPHIGPDKLLRDPSIVKGPDGVFQMVWTTGWNDSIIGHASSKDLVNWSEQQVIPVMTSKPGTKCCWAPELFYDDPSGEFYIFWSSRVCDEDFKIYGVTTKDFASFSEPFLFYTPDTTIIDAAVVRSPIDKALIMAIHASPTPEDKGIHISRRINDDGTPCYSLAEGKWGPMSEKMSGEKWAEGPAPFFVADTMMVFYDQFKNGTYGLSRSMDNGHTWEIVSSDDYGFPEGAVRHGTIFKITEKEFEIMVNNL